MSAFGKRGGMGGGGRPSFGVAKPMKGGPAGASASQGGEQFPPLDDLDAPEETPAADSPTSAPSLGGAMDRLTARQNASGDAASSFMNPRRSDDLVAGMTFYSRKFLFGKNQGSKMVGHMIGVAVDHAGRLPAHEVAHRIFS